ncbi:glycosyltransferase family 2 protein [Maribacter sp. ANRC-HE7]|uniref:Glycosyltransferase family 2 protein n=1 Tax=Maribacter aquimaris TaxID=2737171 RepID=A0ABR7V782_9FLAO|nr:glycosyltransferase family 2 protein [Maribacter aquimaris]MBD0779151.1 glycosyltransferase family 2 protein [Maribacter aquimaris]
MSLTKEKVTALVITFNEVGYIEKCIESVSFADEIIVVDSYSTDGTYEYLLNHPKVKVIQHPFKNFTAQKAFTLKQANNDWVLFLDADEVVSEELQKEIKETINNHPKHVAYWFYRTFMFQNERLHFSGWQTDKNYRLFRKSKVNFSDKRIVHETLDINGTSGKFKNRLTHYCYKDYGVYKNKMMMYGRLKAKEAFVKGKKFSYALLLLKPIWKFFNSYIIRLGFLDGTKGIIICQLDAFCDLERYRELQRLEQEEQWSGVFKTMP